MNKKQKTILYTVTVAVFAAITALTVLLHFSVLSVGSSAVTDFIGTMKGFLCIIIPAGLLLLLSAYKLAAYVKRNREWAEAVKMDTDNEYDLQVSVGTFLKRHQGYVDKAAKSSVKALNSTRELADTSTVVSDALKDNSEFVHYAVDRSVNTNKEAVNKLRKEAEIMAEKLSEAEKYKKK